MASPKYGVKAHGYVSWWKHMKKFGKRQFWKRHRKMHIEIVRA